jgi:hypothetical protein
MSRFSQRSGFRCRAVFGLWAAVCVIPGCGRDQQPVKLVPVVGKVTVNDRPLAEGSVVFWPDPAKGNRSTVPATGGIYGEGNYAMYWGGNQKGVPPGWYKVVVFPFLLPSGERAPKRAPEELPDSPVPTQYMELDTTPLSMEVTEGPAEEAYDLKLTR